MKLEFLVLSAALACCAASAHAVGRLADVTIVDRSTGATLPSYYHRGDYWVAGRPGTKYAILVRNKLGERLLAVTSVDGVNVLSGDTAAWDQTGYVFSEYHQYQITGWRKSSSEVAAFEFSAVTDSYAARTGRPDHVGVIGVALFRERQPEPVASLPAVSGRNESDSRKDQAGTGAAPAQAPGAAGLADSRAEPGAAARGSLLSMERQSKAAGDSGPAPKLGTAHGVRETSVVSRTSFERLQAQPNEIIRVRYDSRENLVASGVIREPAGFLAMPRANPFPLSDQASYVPDPPARRY